MAERPWPSQTAAMDSQFFIHITFQVPVDSLLSKWHSTFLRSKEVALPDVPMYQVVDTGVAWGHMKAHYPSTFPSLAFSTKDGLGSEVLLGQLPQGSASSSQEPPIGPVAVGGPE